MTKTITWADVARRIHKHADYMNVSRIIEAGQHGADTGWAGFTYTNEAAEFWTANAADLWPLLVEQADDMGDGNAASMICKFNRADMIDGGWNEFCNLLAWWALEECGRYLGDNPEEANALRREFADDEDMPA
jgi:hypothetical protein